MLDIIILFKFLKSISYLLSAIFIFVTISKAKLMSPSSRVVIISGITAKLCQRQIVSTTHSGHLDVAPTPLSRWCVISEFTCTLNK